MSPHRDTQDQGTCGIPHQGPCAAPSPGSHGRSLQQGHMGTDPHQVELHLRRDGHLLATQNLLMVPKVISWSTESISWTPKTIS